MPLKSLELVGYKTFASKSTFLFADSITAVVGPNGSGKSNIADALRWVFGEQSYSLLRGKKTSDMIFSGSQERSPAGMASATVTFDNADGWLPIDFSEVTITRRAYRDGQNEYLINNQKVRLRDVSELLGHSGLAERTYTIIGQGLVDAALSLKAEERRRLFEEAAGIGVYRARRADALRRLDLTRRNLERAGDILSELRPRLRSLDRQARRVEEFEQVQADLHVLLRDWYGYHWHSGQADLAEARETARGREKELNEVRSRQSVFDKQILDLRDRIHAQRSRLSGWQDELSKLRGQRERIGRELAVAGERIRALDERGQSAGADGAALDEEIRLQEERLARTLFESEQLQGSAQELRRRLEEITEALARQTKERERVSTTLNEAVRSLNDTETRIAGRAARLDTLNTRLRGLADNRAALEREIAAIQSEIDDNKVNTAAAQEKLATAEQNLRQAASAAEEHTRELRTLAERLEAHRGPTAEKATEAARLGARLEVLIQAEEAGTGLSEGARAILDAGRDGRLTGVRGTLGRLLEAIGEESAALAAALGAYYDAIFVETTGDAQNALDLLIAADAGGTIVPIVHQEETPSIRPPAPEGSLGSLADLIRCPEGLRPAAEKLFGNIYVAETRSEAEQIVKGLLPGSRAVTRDGILFSPEGPVTFAGSGLKGLVGRPQQIEGLETALRSIRTEIESREESERFLASELDALRSRESAIRSQHEEAQKAVERFRAAANETRSWTDQAETQLAWQETRRASLRAETDDVEEQVSDLQNELAELRSRAESLRSEVDRSGRELEDFPLEDIQEQAAHWQTRAAVSQRAAEDAHARVEDRMQAVSDLRRRREDLEGQISSFTAQEDMLSRDSELLQQEERQVEEQIERFKELIRPVEEELRKLESQQDEAQQSEAGARQSLTAAERNHSQAQITLARRQEHLENLRQRIEDDFGLVSFEYDENISGPNPLPLGIFVESLPKVISIAPELGDAIKRQRAQLRRMGAINPDAKKEFDEVRDRFEFMAAQMDDLNKAEHDILETVSELDLLMEREFRKTFDEVAREFRETFTRLFGGGSARLVLTDPGDLTETGVDIEAQLPGRRLQGLSLLSGGERSLTAVALVLSLIKVSPTPFCVLDEVDAMLDEANVNRLSDLLRELSERTQFIVITHNRNTVQAAQTIYGITMGRDSTSQVLSLKLDEVMEIV